MSSHNRSDLDARLARVKQGVSKVELVYASHEGWPYPPGACTSTPLSVSVLDSSFNPPTKAHLALASLTQPPQWSTSSNSHFDARLLLLSVRNADKSLKLTDATYVQRLEMMIHLGRDVPTQSRTSSRIEPNVAVAIIDEPTFVGKARILTEFLHQRMQSFALSSSLHGAVPSGIMSQSEVPPLPETTFIVGMDTLERILAPRYYPSPSDMRVYLRRFLDTSRLICARRVMERQPDSGGEDETVSLAREYLDLERLAIVDLEGDLDSLSSSEVRQKINDGDEKIWPNMVTPNVIGYIRENGLYTGRVGSS